MQGSHHLSAAQTAALTCLGGVIAASAFLTVPSSPTHHHLSTGHIVALVAPFTIGYAILQFASYDLRRGIRLGRWQEQKVDSLRSFTGSPAFLAVGLVLFLGFIGTFVVGYINAGWFCAILTQTLMTLIGSTRRPNDTVSHEPTWSNLAPIRSEQWGDH